MSDRCIFLTQLLEIRKTWRNMKTIATLCKVIQLDR